MAASGKEYTTQNIRNVAVLGHGGSGKTTLIDATSFAVGSSRRKGNVGEGHALTMTTPEEFDHGISMQVTPAFAEYMGTKVNLLDTPGFLDFTGDTIAAVRVADAAVIVVSSTSGVEVGTEVVWEYCEDRKLPRMFFVSLMDKESSSSEGTSVVAPGGHGGTGPEAYIGIKGGARLQLHVKRGDRRFVHIGDAALHPADEIRFQVQGGGWPFLMVIYEDPQGGREVVSPWQGERSLKLDSPEFYPDDALKLDGGLGEERIVAVFSDHSLSSVQVLEWLAQGGSGPGLHEIGGGRIEAVVTTYFKEAPQ